MTLGWERAVEILNFGALLAFMAVNLVALRHFGFSRGNVGQRNLFLDILAPVLGFLFCLVIFLGLQGSTLIVGAIWSAIGGLYVVLKTKGLRVAPVEIDFSES
jgi:hypothetical protein